jgi:predicted nucleic acid-binding protein
MRGSKPWETRRKRDLVICDVVAAEFFAMLRNDTKLDEVLSAFGISFNETSLESAKLAGRIFWEYRKQGGPRNHLVPDFLIAAHAVTQADRLASTDRGYLRAFFPALKLLTPKASNS